VDIFVYDQVSYNTKVHNCFSVNCNILNSLQQRDLNKKFLNSFNISNSGWTIGFSIVNLSGNGGNLETWGFSIVWGIGVCVFGIIISSNGVSSEESSVVSSSSSFSSLMITLGFVLFRVFPDIKWISCIGTGVITYVGKLYNSTFLRGWDGLLLGFGIGCAGNWVGRGDLHYEIVEDVEAHEVMEVECNQEGVDVSLSVVGSKDV